MKTTKRKRETTASAGKARSATARVKSVQAPSAPIAAPAVEAVAQAAPVAPVESAKPLVATVVASASASSLVLGSICCVREAASLKQSLSQLVAADEVVLEVGSLERIDTAGVQLLCAFVRDRAKADRKVTWVGASATLRDAARVLGVSDLLALPEAAA